MKNSLLMKLAVPVALSLVLSYMNCSRVVSDGGTETGNPSVSAMLYNPGGSPAAHAKVRFFPVNYNPRTSGLSKTLAAAVESTATNAQGNYTAKLDTGAYNVLAVGDSGVVYQDSIAVLKDSTIRPPADTLKAPGGLRGRVRLQPGDDARTVLILFFGTNTWGAPDDSTGKFTVANMAEGTYRVRFLTTLDSYVPKDTVLSVTAGKTDSLGHDIVMQYTGIPTPKNLSIAYDTLKQIVTLTWSKADTTLVKGYNVYRRNVDSNTILARINTSLVVDTVFLDCTGIQDKTYEYRVSAVDKSTAEGTKSAGDSVTVASAFSLVTRIGQQGTGPGQYSTPNGISISNQEIIMIADYDLGNIVSFDTDGTFQKSYSGFNAPSNVVCANGGRFYVVEKNTHLIKLVDSTGVVLSQFGGSGTQNGQFSDISPSYFVISRDNRLYVPDYGGNRIQIFDTIGTYLRELPISAPWSISFLSASKVAVGSDAMLSVLDTNGTIESTWLGVFALASATTKNGNVVIATIEQEGSLSVQKIAFYSPQGKRLAIFGASDQNSSSYFNTVAGIAVYSNNNLYVVDSGKKQVKVFIAPLNL